MWIFRHHSEKEPDDEDHLDGCDEYRGDWLLRFDCSARGPRLLPLLQVLNRLLTQIRFPRQLS